MTRADAETAWRTEPENDQAPVDTWWDSTKDAWIDGYETGYSAALPLVDELRLLVERFYDGSPCRYDHHDYCQAHSLHERPCPHEQAVALLATLPSTEENR